MSNNLKTCFKIGLFLEMAYMAYTFGKNKGKGDDLFLLSLLITCLKVSRYPV